MSERPESGVRRAVRHRDWTGRATCEEAACARPTNWAPPPRVVEIPRIERPTLGSFEDVLSEVERWADAELDVLPRPSTRDDRDTAELLRELGRAREAVDELSARVAIETEHRRLLEIALDDARREAEACDERLREMSRSHYDALAALRRAYEQRLHEATCRSR